MKSQLWKHVNKTSIDLLLLMMMMIMMMMKKKKKKNWVLALCRLLARCQYFRETLSPSSGLQPRSP
jgi:hypothetical protein